MCREDFLFPGLCPFPLAIPLDTYDYSLALFASRPSLHKEIPMSLLFSKLNSHSFLSLSLWEMIHKHARENISFVLFSLWSILYLAACIQIFQACCFFYINSFKIWNRFSLNWSCCRSATDIYLKYFISVTSTLSYKIPLNCSFLLTLFCFWWMTYGPVDLCKVLLVSRKCARMIQHLQGETLFFPLPLNSSFPILIRP